MTDLRHELVDFFSDLPQRIADAGLSEEAAVGVALAMRQGQAENDVFERLAADARLGLTTAQLDSLVADPITFTGAAVDQVQAVARRVEEVCATYPEAAAYTPGAIL